MKDIIEGFLKFQSDAFPDSADLFKKLPTKQNLRALLMKRVITQINASA
jgi:carbonic anhydrase